MAESSELAIEGGAAVIPEGPPSWPPDYPEVARALLAAYADGSWGRYHATHVPALAARLAQMHQVEHVHLCSSGTVAVELALRGLGVEPGDEVILAGYDFPGNFRAIEAIGARPVLVDIDPASWCLDPRGLEAAFSSQTRAIIVSHLHGGIAKMRQIVEQAKAHGVGVVEDACQTPGAVVDGRMAGTWGDVGVLSFGGSKLLTAGRGGALVTRSAQIAQRAKVYVERGNDAYPLSELQAAVLLPQLEMLSDQNALRAAQVARLLGQLNRVASLLPVQIPAPPEIAGYYKLAWRYAPSDAAIERERFVTAVRAEGVALDAGFRGFAGRSSRRCRRVGELTHALAAAAQTVILHHPVLLSDDATIDRVARAVEKVDRLLGRR